MPIQNNKSCSIEGYKVNYLKCHIEKYVQKELPEIKYFLNDVEYTQSEMQEILIRLHNLAPSLFEVFKK